MSVGNPPPAPASSPVPVPPHSKFQSVPPGSTIIIQPGEPSGLFRRIRNWMLYTALMISLLFNFQMLSEHSNYFSASESPTEKYHSGDKDTKNRIALIQVSGTIMPPLTSRVMKDIKKAREDDNVKAVVLQVNSPGGLVSDSHEIYHELQKLNEKKPVVCSMRGLAASGGLYIAMGVGKKGKIFAEPTTWTGSIGVIIPRYQIKELADKWGIKSEPLKTGPFKDALSPFHELKEDERKVWENILDQAFVQFLTVIDENREKLNMEQVRKLATGQIYTAKDALNNGLVDAIGFEEDAIKAAQEAAGLEKSRVVTYSHATGLLDLLSAKGPEQADAQSYLRQFMDATVPRAMYYFTSAPVSPSGETR